jgi:sulfite reductase (ferredoxin)
VLFNLPLGDLTSRQARSLADIVRKYTNDSLRTTVDQNVLLRWVHRQHLAAVYNDHAEARLSLAGAATIADVTICPGTDTCKLGIASSRGLGAELRALLERKRLAFDDKVKEVHIRVSGCPNSCGLHHIADIGFYGSSRSVGAYKVPHFKVIPGGSLENNAENYGLAIGAMPSRRAPEVVDRLLGFYSDEQQPGESFRGWVSRVGKKVIKERLKDLAAVPAYEEDPSYYVDWHDSREYSIGDIGVGECAGEVVSLTEFSLAAAEAKVFDASLLVENGDGTRTDALTAGRMAYAAIVAAAEGLIKTQNVDVNSDADAVFAEFSSRFIDTQLFFERYVGASEWPYYQTAQQTRGAVANADEARRRVGEAQLFIEAAHACYSRLREASAAAKPEMENAALRVSRHSRESSRDSRETSRQYREPGAEGSIAGM